MGWVAGATGLIQQIPGKNGRVILVYDTCDAVDSVGCHVQVVLEQLQGFGVGEEEVRVVGASGPLNILQASCAKFRGKFGQEAHPLHKQGD